MSWYQRYLAGEHERVWAEMVAAGSDACADQHLDEAWQVATETMRRVLANAKTVEARLRGLGYRFSAEETGRAVLREANDEDRANLRAFESKVGALPLSIKAFFEVIGEVSFVQAHGQCSIEDMDVSAAIRAGIPTLEMLGRFGPLEVPALFDVEQRQRGLWPQRDGDRWYHPLVPDECTKAWFSGDSYYTWFPADGVDVQLGTLQPGQGEFFVEHLRRVFEHGGFGGFPIDDGGFEHANAALRAQLCEGLEPL